MSRLTRLVRENQKVAEQLTREVSKPIPRVVEKRKPVRCSRRLDGKPGVGLTAGDIAAWLPLVPQGAKITPLMTYFDRDYVRVSAYARPDTLSGLEAVWYEDDRA